MATAPPLPNSELSKALLGDYEALHADVHQANALAADFRQHSAGNSNELAVLQQVFEKAQQDLTRLNESIARLRQERHKLANEAMRAMALDRKLAEVTLERDRLRAEGHAMRNGLIASGEESARRKRETDAQIARMALELDALRHRPSASAATPAPSGDFEIRTALAQIFTKLDCLTKQLAEDPRPARTERSATPATREPEPTIDIQFES